MKKDVTTLGGLIAAFGLVLMAIFDVGSEFSKGISATLGPKIGIFFDMPSLFIVIGGTVGAVLINFKSADITKIPSLASKALTAPSEGEEAETISQIVELSQEARVNGLLSLEPKIKTIENDFLRNGLEMVVDGVESEAIRESLENELAFMQRRHLKGQQIFLQGGMFCPAFGMVGTLVGLVKMMTDLTDIVQIANNMQVALLTTFYGSLFANTFFLPIGGKLQIMSQNEVILKELMIEGILSIPKGENPKVLKKYLETFIAPKRRGEDA